MQPDLVAELATEEIPDGGAVVLALDVPQRDVDGAQRSRQDVAAERAHPVEGLLDVVDAKGVLADEVLAELVDDRRRGVREAPGAGLADAGEAAVGRDPDDVVGPDQIASDEESLDLLDLHAAALTLSPASGRWGRPSRVGNHSSPRPSLAILWAGNDTSRARTGRDH